jgi:hypothetical protein
MLRSGSARDAGLLAEWQAHGEDAFTYEVLEELDPDVTPMLLRDTLQAKQAEWAAREHARTLLP